MFEKVIITLILVLAAILVFSGCSTVEKKAEQLENEIESRLDPVGDAMESKADAAENAIEQALEDALTPDATAADNAEQAAASDVQDTPLPDELTETQADPVQGSLDKLLDIVGGAAKDYEASLSDADTSAFITAEAAQQIALAHAGVEASAAVFDRTEREYENGVWYYDVEFRVGLVEHEYEIHAETGTVLSFEKDN